MPYPSKNTSTYTSPSKNSNVGSLESKDNSTYTSPSKNTSIGITEKLSSIFCLIKEDGKFLFLETYGKIVLSRGVADWTYNSKS